ncbi:MAG: hypothetical protein OXH39_20415 [Candidatus Poribacteria bacterium]|nr:hypothetical protein [Candidatus Poribacteria bacterium]
MFNSVFYGLNIIVWLALAVLLVVLCLRTRSKGLILISAILLTSGMFNSIFEQVLGLYMDRWIASEITGERVQNMNIGDFLMSVALVKPLLYSCLCLLGGFLVYREWRLGKFRNPQPEQVEEPKA